MTKLSRMEVPPTPEVLGQDGVVVEEADAKNRGVLRARRRHPLEGLYHRSNPAISREQFDAGMTFSCDFDVAQRGNSAAQYDGVPPPDTYQSRTPGMGAMKAAARVQGAKKALGRQLSVVAVVVCGEGHSVAEFASRRGMSAHQATGYLIAALDRLSEYYGG